MKFSAIITITVAVVAVANMIVVVEAKPNRIRHPVVERRSPNPNPNPSVLSQANANSMTVAQNAQVARTGSRATSYGFTASGRTTNYVQTSNGNTGSSSGIVIRAHVKV